MSLAAPGLLVERRDVNSRRSQQAILLWARAVLEARHGWPAAGSRFAVLNVISGWRWPVPGGPPITGSGTRGRRGDPGPAYRRRPARRRPGDRVGDRELVQAPRPSLNAGTPRPGGQPRPRTSAKQGQRVKRGQVLPVLDDTAARLLGEDGHREPADSRGESPAAASRRGYPGTAGDSDAPP